MAGLIDSLVTAVAATAARSNYAPAPAATHIAPRRPHRHQLDAREPADDKAESQLESFRGSIYAAVDKIGRRLSQLPVRLVQREHAGEDRFDQTVVRRHPFISLLGEGPRSRPHEEMTRWELDYWTSISLDLAGEAWWLVERDKYGVPARVTPLPAHRIMIIYNQDTGLIAGYLFTPPGASVYTGSTFIPRLSWEVLQSSRHLTTPFMVFFRYPSPLGIEDPRGWSPVKAAAYSYDINLFEHIYKRNFLKQGAQLGGILQSEVALSKEQIEEYLEQFEAKHRGPARAGLPIVLPKMLKWHTTEPTPRDLQWVETIGATSSDIYEIFGISDSKLGRADVGTRATADAMDVTFNREVIQSRLDLKRSQLDTNFLPIYPGQTDDLYFCAQFDDPLPEDREYALRQERQDVQEGIRTRNEIRAKRGDEVWGTVGNMINVPGSDTLVDVASADPLGDISKQKPKKSDEGKLKKGKDEKQY